jgi:hypothetical protein
MEEKQVFHPIEDETINNITKTLKRIQELEREEEQIYTILHNKEILNNMPLDFIVEGITFYIPREAAIKSIEDRLQGVRNEIAMLKTTIKWSMI